MRKSFLVFLLILLFFSVISLTGQTVLTTLEEVAEYGVKYNLNYKNSQINVQKADVNRTGILKVENSSISAEANYSDNNGFGFNSTLTVPVIEQISLSASMADDLSGQIGISLHPLSHSAGNELSEISYNSSLLSAESARINAENYALSSALNWMSANRELSAQKINAELTENLYQDDKIRYSVGEITLDDLQDSLIEWSEARISLSEKQKNFHNAESSLYDSLGRGSDDVFIEELDLDTLNESLLRLKGNFVPQMGNSLKNDEYKISLLDVKSAEASYKNTWAYNPDLIAGASLGFNSSGNINVSANIQFSISPDDFQKKKRDIAEEELQVSVSIAEQSLKEAQLDYEQVLESISSTELNSEISRVELEQVKILLSEAELLQKLGEYSQVELQLSQLRLQQTENSLFRALSDEYQAWLELKKYM